MVSKLNLPLASPLDLSEDRVWRKGEIKRLNLETTDRIKELVQELDRLVAAADKLPHDGPRYLLDCSDALVLMSVSC